MLRVLLRSTLSVGSLGMLVTSVVLHAKPLALDPEQISLCESLGPFSASSGYGKNPNWISIALTYAEQRAAKAGATHYIIRSKRSIGTFNGEVTLDAYRCPISIPQ